MQIVWRYYRIEPLHHPELGETFYAPSLELAFKLARGRWPGYASLYCRRSWTEKQNDSAGRAA